MGQYLYFSMELWQLIDVKIVILLTILRKAAYFLPAVVKSTEYENAFFKNSMVALLINFHSEYVLQIHI